MPRSRRQSHARARRRAGVGGGEARAQADRRPPRAVCRALLAWTVAGIVAVSLTACTPWRLAYLRGAVDHATQDEITTRLGPPLAARELATGETVWRYQSYQGDLLCLEYILRFDRAQILRQWTRQAC